MKEKIPSSLSISVIGDVVLDAIPSPFPLEKSHILEDGETFIDNISFQRGGCAGNFASVFTDVFPTIKTHLYSRVGMTPFGGFLINEFKKPGIISHIVKDFDKKTQSTLALTYLDGNRHFKTYLGALSKFSVQDLSFSSIFKTNHIAYRGIWFSEQLLFTIEQLFMDIKQNGDISISMDLGFDPYWNLPNPSKNLEEHMIKRKTKALKLVQYTDILFGNECELLHLTNKSNLMEAVSILFDHSAKIVVCHQGEKGSTIFSSNEEPLVIPSQKVSILNPVGTGDTFDAVFLGFWLQNYDLQSSADFATRAALYSLSHPPGSRISISQLGLRN